MASFKIFRNYFQTKKTLASKISNNQIDNWAFASDGNGTDVGDLVETNDMAGGVSATDYGYFCGGRNTSNRIQRHSYSSDGNGADWADMTVSKSGQPAGTQE